MRTPTNERAVSEVEFHLSEASYPFVELSAVADCHVELTTMIERDDDRYAEFVNVTGADPVQIESVAGETDTVDATFLHRTDDRCLFEFLVSGNCPAYRLAALGALPRTVEGVDGEGCIVAEIPRTYDDAAIVERFLAEIPEADLVTKRTKSSVDPLLPGSAIRQAFETNLTERQREVLETAYEAGYYDWPRECTGEAVARRLDVSSAAFSETIHAAERNLLATLFEDDPGDRSE
ncbi:bacterio-opsin activator domain-containing protein [Halovivax cerinus]|uniref:Bacterio-opsin activator domain-containing protein n=1 Tax=Halovivax cerinus TaxID=1487865 RepID=A0ABD5NJN8_9EURY|nr:bacterio-opsin activator domain-containing protein [Halovivax cerinus]